MTIARVTQQYIEAAVLAETRNARVTQQYIEVATLPIASTSTPIMTSNTTPSGIASASSIDSATYDAWKAFSDTNATNTDCWISDVPATVGTPQWLRYQFPISTIIRAFAFNARDDTGYWEHPVDFKLQGSNNGTDWTDLHTVVGLSLNPRQRTPIYVLDSPSGYTYYQIYITDSSGSNWVAISCLSLYRDGWPINNPAADYTSPPPLTISASTEYSGDYRAWKAFVATNYDYYQTWISSSAPTVSVPQWLKIQLHEARTVQFFRFRTRNSSNYSYPSDFKLQGSNNDTDWDDLCTVTGYTGLASNQRSQYFYVNTPASYNYYRLYITARTGSDNWVGVSDLALYGTETPETIDKARLTQEAVEVVSEGTPAARLSQEAVEIISSGVVDVTVNQFKVEMLENAGVEIAVNQIKVEVLMSNTGWAHSVNGVSQPSAINSVALPSSVNGVA